MDFYNIRIINQGRNEYRGNIIIDDNNSLYGLCTEKNYDNKKKLLGQLTPEGLYLVIKGETENIPILANQSTSFPKKSLFKASYFTGNSLDSINDLIFIELVNIKDIEQGLIKESKTSPFQKKL